MNDEELNRRLSDELHRRIHAPEVAPEVVHEHLRDLRTMRRVGGQGLGRAANATRNLFGVAATVAIAVALVAGWLAWQAPRTHSGGPGMPASIEMFGRIDAGSAWAESGSDLYVTRDGGATWTKGTVPGGRSPAQIAGSLSNTAEATLSEATPTPILPGHSQSTDVPASVTYPDHLYPNFIDADHGWLLSWKSVGASTALSPTFVMTAWRTTDGGQTWASAQLPGTYKGEGVVQFTDASHGWITIVRTDYEYASASSTPDSGSGTAAAETPASTASPQPPSDATTILATSDGGATWSVASRLAAIGLPRFISPTEAWGYTESAGTTTVIHSTDAGRNWSEAELPLPSGDTVMGWPSPPVREGDSLVITVASQDSGDHASVAIPILQFSSADDGGTWKLESTRSVDGSAGGFGYATLVNLPVEQPLVAYEASQVSSGPVATGLKASFDGGKTWIDYSLKGLPAQVDIAEWLAPDDVWVMVRQFTGTSYMTGRLYSSHDMGKTWMAMLGASAWPASPDPEVTLQPAPVTPPPLPVPSGSATGPAIFDSMARVDAKTGLVWVTEPDGGSAIRMTVDNGATWSDARSLPEATIQLQFVDQDHGWAVGFGRSGPNSGAGAASVARTTDGGRTWQESSVAIGTLPPTGQTLATYFTASVHFHDLVDGELFAVYGTDGGAMQSATPTPTGSGTRICKAFSTTDGGATWSEGRSIPCLTQVKFVDGGLGYASDYNPSHVLYVTQDGGRTWVAGTLPNPGVILDSTTEGARGDAAVPTVELLEHQSSGGLRAFVSWPGIGMTVVSTDGGRTWTAAGRAKAFDFATFSISSRGEGNWIAIGGQPGSAGTRKLDVRTTNDAGLTWTGLAVQGLPDVPSSVAFAGASEGWAAVTKANCGSASSTATPQPCHLIGATIYASHDGGATWSPMVSP